MSTRLEVVNELRSLFQDGATPSRLIRHIVERHAGERRYHQLIQDYFREAFGIPSSGDSTPSMTTGKQTCAMPS
jgi:hypothetical protein